MNTPAPVIPQTREQALQRDAATRDTPNLTAAVIAEYGHLKLTVADHQPQVARLELHNQVVAVLDEASLRWLATAGAPAALSQLKEAG